MCEITTLQIPTKENYSLSATKFSSQKNNSKTIVISSATGVLQRYYSKFATYFATQGYTVYTFDYSGIGNSGSDITSLKKNGTNLINWGKIDQSTIVGYTKTTHPNHEIILLTHSIGGQIIGFNPNYIFIDKIIMIASQSGYWGHFNGFDRPKMWLFWHVMIPILTATFGYFPAKKLGLFENLPKNMVYEWRKWGIQKEYLMHFYNERDYFFKNIKTPLLSFSFPNDPYAPKKAVDWLTTQYSNTSKERVHYTPSDTKISELKHFGFFREKFKTSLWQQTDNWINKN